MSKTRIGNYKLGKLLGYGNFAVVRHGENTVTNHQVAVKIINKKKLKKQKMVEALQKEIALSRLFDHPHVIKMYEYLNSQDSIYVITEFAPKGELFEYICNEGYLSETIARRFFQQIVYAVEYVHGKGVSHRDLKLENILLDENLNIKLGDFGLCNRIKDGRALFTSCGTPHYAAPEIMQGRSYDGHQVDVWSCGVILYAMLHGELPFDSENISELTQTICNCNYNMKKTITDEAKDLISRMLQPNPMLRITISEILSHPWFCENVPKYLKNYMKFCDQNLKVDQQIIEKLCCKYDDFSEERKQMIQKDIEEGGNSELRVYYNFFLRDKLMSKISSLKMEGSKSTTFCKRKLVENKRRNIKTSYQALENLQYKRYKNE